MKFTEKPISHERCEQINNMNILCPWSGEVFKMHEDGYKYLANEDESIIYGAAFLPNPQDMAYDSATDYKDYYFLIMDNEYFLHALKLVSYKKEKINDILHVYKSFELPNDEKINKREDKEDVLFLINYLYSHYFSQGKNKKLKQVLIYNGKEYD